MSDDFPNSQVESLDSNLISEENTEKKSMDWREAITYVLEKSNEAMRCSDIANKIIQYRLRDKVGATPANTINAVISGSITNDGQESPFLRVSRGSYILKSKINDEQKEEKQETQKLEDDTKSEIEISLDEEISSDSPESGGIIQAFGMFWRADKVSWRSGSKKTKIYGVQQTGADRVDFYDQIGIYMLHDRNKVIYIGRVLDRPLGQRLYEHTRDRHNGRWDRFSWFGFKKVSDDGTLENIRENVSIQDVIIAMEAVLIEGLEPPQNRKRGDSISEIEYQQEEDPSLKKDQMKKMLEQALMLASQEE